jgi:hypothetical protein
MLTEQQRHKGAKKAMQTSRARFSKNYRAANAIDFFMRVPGLPFHDAMRQITG